MTVVRLTARMVLGAARLVGALVAIAVLGAGVPLLWVWIGSLLQGGTAPSLSGIGVTLAGIVLTYAGLAMLFGWVQGRADPEERPVRYGWNRSLSEARRRGGENTHALEDIVAVATILVGLVCTVWFFLFGDPGVPIAP